MGYSSRNGILYSFDATKCMFSSGNLSEKLRMAGWIVAMRLLWIYLLELDILCFHFFSRLKLNLYMRVSGICKLLRLFGTIFMLILWLICASYSREIIV
ncbi:tRNA wybutosine-synthesizing protein 2/3/4 [Platanthera zijinensis]|uniref:tRNA wybutosine-synthesizing protein 2/3/4 n=1 Tax=Platanthera zijinensis TaxID=2320716 RepID=A0AAP0G7Y9_9ASPA